MVLGVGANGAGPEKREGSSRTWFSTGEAQQKQKEREKEELDLHLLR